MGQLVLGFLLLQLGLQVFDGIAAGVELGFLRGGVDLHQQLALLDLVAGLDVDLADLPGGLGADVYVTSRLQGAQGGDAVFDVGAGHGDGGQGIAARRQALPGGKRNDGNQARHHKQGASGRSRAFHG
ncbi:hypothetical protein PFLmoz3_00755 [Pseudomonas fluorescens]|uniref:Uncharacterized protein n=1 Tax=Pseudomonas fluorescens TaxID=294 RepID=A0A109LKL7_PSEFL|nr:hypothetical protein PFLmoz3_00755 [Pseudomonas fluorescens]